MSVGEGRICAAAMISAPTPSHPGLSVERSMGYAFRQRQALRMRSLSIIAKSRLSH